MVEHKVINGVDVDELAHRAHELQENPELAKFHFRISNRWLDGGHSRTKVEDFEGVGERLSHKQTFRIEADEPDVLLGNDQGPNPVEHLLNALAGCLTSSLVYHAASRGIRIDAIQSTIEGDLDIRGFMGLSNDVRKGYQNIRVTFRVKSDADEQKLSELAQFSPVFDTVSHGTDISLRFEKSQ